MHLWAVGVSNGWLSLRQLVGGELKCISASEISVLQERRVYVCSHPQWGPCMLEGMVCEVIKRVRGAAGAAPCVYRCKTELSS